MTNIQEMTFKTLFENNKFDYIEIPLLQRDYAQGRLSECKKLEDFLQDIGNLCGDGTNKSSMSLNFIYGYKNAAKSSFVPIDGQQRLTLLFLLNVYVYLNADANIPTDSDAYKEWNESKNKFRYDMRRSTERFLKALIKNSLPDRKNSLKQEIVKQNWFFPQWKKDPTINSMLVVLDKIDKEFCNRISDLEKSLNKIKFKFLDIKNLDQDENLYIKLNARGVPLSDFENFRARLIKKVEKDASNIKNDFKKKLDGEWTELFWSIAYTIDKTNKKDKKENSPINVIFDKMFFNFIKNILVNETLKTVRDMSPEDIFQTIDLDEGTSSINAIYHTMDGFYKIMKSVTPDKSDIEKTVLIFRTEYPYFYRLITKGVIGQGTGAGTYSELALLNAVTSFAKCSKTNDQSEHWIILFQEYYRVLRNLILNTDINADNYKHICNSINNINSEINFSNILVVKNTDIVNYIRNLIKNYDDEDKDAFKGFNLLQLKEERKKLDILLKNTDFEQIIKNAEKNPYFSGQISFLLSLSGFSLSLEEDNDDNTIDEKRNNMKKYCNLIDLLFNTNKNDNNIESSLQIDDLVWRRSLLAFAYNYAQTKNDELYYPIKIARSEGMYSFIVNSPTERYGWKMLLNFAAHHREEKLNDKKNKESDSIDKNFYELARLFFAQLKDQPTIEEIENKLKGIIYSCTVQDKDDWRYWFIHKDKDVNFDVDDLFKFCFGNSTQWLINTDKGNIKNLIHILRGRNFQSFYFDWVIIRLWLAIRQFMADKKIPIKPLMDETKDYENILKIQGIWRKIECSVSLEYDKKTYTFKFNSKNKKYAIEELADKKNPLPSEEYDLDGVITYLKEIVLR